MPMQPITIDEFKRFGSTMEVVGVGRVRQPRGNAQESEVEVVLAERREGRFDVARPSVAVWLGCGQLDLVTIGSRWTGGKRDDFTARPVRTATVEPKDSAVLGMPFPEPGSFRYVPTELISDAPCFRLCLSGFEGFGAGDQIPRLALVPRIELARALFGVSSRMLLEMFDGLRDGRVAADRGIFDRKRSVALSASTVRIFCPRRLRQREALLVAGYVSDQKIRASYDGFFQSLVMDQGYMAQRPAFAKPSYPFVGPSRWTFDGRWMLPTTSGDAAAQGSKVFVVTRIHGITFPVGFDLIEMYYGPTTTTKGSAGLPPPNGRFRVVPTRRVVLATGRAPSAGQHVTEVSIEGTIVHADVDVRVVAIPVSVTIRPEGGSNGGGGSTDLQSSTAGREAGGDPDVGAIVLRRGRAKATPDELDMQAAEVSAALAKTQDALLLAARDQGWSLRFVVGPSKGGTPPGGTGVSSRFFDEILQVEVETDFGFVTVVDVGTLPHDRRSLGILRPLHDANLTVREDSEIRTYTAKHGGHWLQSKTMRSKPTFVREALIGFTIRSLQRPAHVWGDASAYASLLVTAIAGVLAEQP